MLWLNKILPWVIYAVMLGITVFIIVEAALLVYISVKREVPMKLQVKLVKNYNKTDQFDMSECQTIYYWMDINKVPFKVLSLTANTISVIAEPENESEVEHLKLYGFTEMEEKV